jgi:hypothetical protein
VSNDILKLPNGQLELEKPFKLFDMKKFQQNVNRELKRQYPERHKLETQVSLVGAQMPVSGTSQARNSGTVSPLRDEMPVSGASQAGNSGESSRSSNASIRSITSWKLR